VRPALLLPLMLLLLVMLLPVANAFVFGKVTITTFSVRAPAVVEQGVKFTISATIGVSGATYPIYVYLVANSTVWGLRLTTHDAGNKVTERDLQLAGEIQKAVEEFRDRLAQ